MKSWQPWASRQSVIQRDCAIIKKTRFFNRFFQKCKPVSRDLFFSFRNHYHCHLLSFGRRHLNFWYQTSWKHTLNFIVWAERKKVSELLKKYLSLKNTLLFTLHIKLDVIDYSSSTLEKSANWFLPELDLIRPFSTKSRINSSKVTNSKKLKIRKIRGLIIQITWLLGDDMWPQKRFDLIITTIFSILKKKCPSAFLCPSIT